MITLFEATSREFSTNGLGNLPDAVSCSVVEERNGKYELEMKYPVTGKRFSDLQMRRIIVAKPNPFANPQPFRIYAIAKPINGMVTVNAEHISYDLSGYPASPFTANTAANALSKLNETSAVSCPFSFWTDKTTAAVMTVEKPSSIRSLLGGVQGSILDLYGGEFEFDGFMVKLHSNRGNEKTNAEKVTIRYGKNLTDLQQDENCSSVYTGVYPFWFSDKKEGGGYVALPEKIVRAEGNYNFTRICPLDLSHEWQDKPTQTQLREKAKTYINNNQLGVPKVSLTVSFAQLSQSKEFKDYALLETVHLCDMVVVEFPELGVNATAKCIATTYNVLTGKYEKLELGDARSNLASTILSQTQKINETAEQTKSFLEKVIETTIKLISGNLGGYVVVHSSTGGDRPDEILIMNTDNIQTATKVWRWNKGGLSYSDKGYEGPYKTAITQNGQFVADFITTGTMEANRIKGGTLTLGSKDSGYGNCLVKDNDGNVLITLDEKGITLSNDVKISYDNVSNTPYIPNKTSDLLNDSGFKNERQVTEITRDTITTSYVNALDITAKKVNCKSGDREANINGGYSNFKYKNKNVGHIGTNHWVGTEKYGLFFDLDMDGNYMAWARKEDVDSYYMVCLHYSRDDDMLHAGANLDMNNYQIKNVSFENGITGEMHFVQILEVDQNGIPKRFGTDASLKFKNGILVGMNYYG